MSPKTWCNSTHPNQKPKSVFRLFLISLSYQQGIHYHQYSENDWQWFSRSQNTYFTNIIKMFADFIDANTHFWILRRFVMKAEWWSSEPLQTTFCMQNHTDYLSEILTQALLSAFWCQWNVSSHLKITQRMFKKFRQTLTKITTLMTQNTCQLKQDVSAFKKTKQKSYASTLVSLGAQNGNPSPCKWG